LDGGKAEPTEKKIIGRGQKEEGDIQPQEEKRKQTIPESPVMGMSQILNVFVADKGPTDDDGGREYNIDKGMINYLT
jgi:hypothetical protein